MTFEDEIPKRLERTYQCLACDGYDYHCKQYFNASVALESPDLCFWYESLERALDALRVGERVKTWDGLAELLRKVE